MYLPIYVIAYRPRTTLFGFKFNTYMKIRKRSHILYRKITINAMVYLLGAVCQWDCLLVMLHKGRR